MADESLRDFISQVSGNQYLKVEEDLGDGFVRLRTAEAERRQAKHDIRCVEDIVIEMLRNARDAGANSIFVATTREGNTRKITMLDNGDGIPENLHEKIFEPRVTSKLNSMVMDTWGVHGRGMALYSIRENVKSVQVMTSDPGKGSSFLVIVDLYELPEKADQSTAPELVRDIDGSKKIGRGPHNVIRQVLEFSIENPKIDVYLGSPAEILSTLAQTGKRSIDEHKLLFCDDLRELPVCLRPAACADAVELTRTAASLGLDVSERTAHRVMAGTIKPLKPAIARIVPRKELPAEDKPIDLMKDRRGLHISDDDLESFKRSLESAFDVIGDRYFISLAGKPRVTVSGDTIRVRFDIEKG
jgi:hypothetical protein